MEHPIACTLTGAAYAQRVEETSELARRALRSRRPIAGGVRLTFAAGAGTERRLREIVAAEARCCPFLRLDLRPAAGALVLDVTGPAEVEPFIAGLFA
jgi:MerR family transcriptional regulator, copper efflux regulator